MKKLVIQAALILAAVPGAASAAFQIPEPSMLPLLALGLVGAAVLRHKRNK